MKRVWIDREKYRWVEIVINEDYGKLEWCKTKFNNKGIIEDVKVEKQEYWDKEGIKILEKLLKFKNIDEIFKQLRV
ncbi:MAG: hypothetical protein NC915_06595 [Candidatus Omnitrophica bacterium]|nr:hypothetical protein [Candidatus Omnitrophota bacterium]